MRNVDFNDKDVFYVDYENKFKFRYNRKKKTTRWKNNV